MDCPKCGHRQDDTVKCESCGVYFAKLAAPGPTSRQLAPSAPESRGFGVGTVALAAVAAAGLVHHLMRQNSPAQIPTAPRPSVAAPAPATAPMVNIAAAAHSDSTGVGAIEAARGATVFIRTAWGLGSGFILDAQCHVITNRHVVETDGARVAASVDRTPEMQNTLAVTQQRLVSAINAAQLRRRILAGQPGTNLEQLQLEEHIRQWQQTLATLPQQIDANITEKVNEGDRSGFSVTLPDGTHYEALHAVLSENADLALIRLPADHCPFIHADRGAVPRVGERVYTIGNPSGLAYTVTTGVVSGLRELNGKPYVQTDAPINPGNSGGPLINEQGQVIGINSMVMRGVNGIGFAIPIEAVYTEFPQL
jgi:S1-C subfamily serine protease